MSPRPGTAAGAPRNDRRRDAARGDDSAVRPISGPPARRPVVLAHGLLGFARAVVGPIAGVAYFRGIEERFVAEGVRVLAPAVPATGSIARRGRALRDAVVAAFPGEKVHIVAHSMGGLDARHAITHEGLAAQVVTLTTLGTPHRGSPVADVGTRLARKAGVFRALRLAGIDAAAFDDLRSDACAAFNERTPDAPEVRYTSVAGRRARDATKMNLRATFDVVAAADGPNDGLVSVRSARWGEAAEEVDADHLDLVGWTLPGDGLLGRPADVDAVWAGILARLAAADTL